MLLELTVAEQRFNAVMEVLRDGLTVIEVAERYGVSRQAVHSWLRRYRTGGLEALALGWNVPPYGSPPGAYGQVPAGHHLPENRQNGQSGLPVGNGADPAGPTKRQRIEEYLDWLGPDELQHLTVRELTSDLASQGLEVTERYVKQILDQQRPPPQPQRRRGSGGARKPRDDRN